MKNHSLSLSNARQEKKACLISAHRMEIQENNYIVMMANLKVE